jgi:hypothetical protein
MDTTMVMTTCDMIPEEGTLTCEDTINPLSHILGCYVLNIVHIGDTLEDDSTEEEA